MLGRAAGWFGMSWLRGVALMVALFAATGTAIWTAAPVPLAGQLVDTSGHPVGGAAIDVAGTLLSPSRQATSDARGRYRLGARRWPNSVPRLSVEAPGFVPAQTTGGRLVLHRWPEVTGRVVDDSGEVVPGAVLALTHLGSVVGAAMTGLDGRFSMMVPGVTGAAAVSAFMDQHDTASQQVTLATDQSIEVQLMVARQFAKLHVESDPSGQAPLVDGAVPPDCQATPCEATVLAGAHVVSFAGDLYVPWQAEVQVDKSATVPVHAQLQRKTGTVVLSAPGQGELEVDGQPVDRNPWTGPVPTGQHTVSFRSAATWPALQQVAVAWNQTVQATLAPAAISSTDPGAFLAGLRAYLAAQPGGTYGVYLEELSSGATIGVGDATVLEAASVIKVPEALYLLHQVDGGQVKLTDQVELHPEDFMTGTGSLYGTANPGDRYSYQQLLSLLIQQSDNTAWMALRRVLGDGQIDAYAASLGAGDCVQGTDNCSARSAGHLMAQLARGRLLSAGSTQLLLGLLETTIFNDRINYYLGRTTIAHKVGMDGAVRNDCGVVFLAGNPFAVCVFTTDDNTDQGIQVIRDVARAAAWYYGH